MAFWYFLVEYGTLLFIGAATWLGSSKIYVSNFINNPESHFKLLNDFLTKWGSLINIVAIVTGIISIIPILTDYFGDKHYICKVSALNVRNNPGTYSTALTSIKGQTEVTIISDIEYDNHGDPWIKIKGKGFSGWVSQTKVCTHE